MRVLLVIVLAVLILPAAAQEVSVGRYDSVGREALNPAIVEGSVAFRTRNGTSEFSFVEANFALPLSGLQGWINESDPRDGWTLSRIAEETGALAVGGLTMPTQLADQAEISGLLMAQGRIASWPPRGTQLVLWSEGAFSFEEFDSPHASVSVDGGTSFTLVSVNGALPERASEAALYTGRLEGDELPFVTMPADLVVINLKSRNGTNPHEQLGSGNGAEFEIGKIVTLREMRIAPPDAALILSPLAQGETLRGFQDGARLRVDMPLPQRLKIARTALTVGRVIVRDGRAVRDIDPSADFINVIALDRSGRKMMYLSAVEETGRRFGAGLERIVDFLSREGYSEAAEVPADYSLLLADASDRRLRSLSGNNRVLSGVVFLGFRPALRDTASPEGLHRIAGLVAAGTRTEFPGNSASSATDGQTAVNASLNTFWATPITDFNGPAPDLTKSTNRLHILLPRPMPVAAIELIHAETLGFSPQFNLKRWRLQGRAPGNNRWEVLLYVDNEEPVARERLYLQDTPVLQELTLDIIDPNFLPGGNVARLSELILWSPEQTVEGDLGIQ